MNYMLDLEICMCIYVWSHQSVSSDELFWHNSSANNANVPGFGTLSRWEVLHPKTELVCQITSHWHYLLKSYAKTAHQRTLSGDSTHMKDYNAAQFVQIVKKKEAKSKAA